MKENNEYGNCWQDLMRRVDAENRVADAIIEAWQIEEEAELELDETGAYEKKKNEGRADENKREGKARMNKEYSEVGRKRMKEKTGEEMRVVMAERNEKGRLKRARAEARKMVKRGKMKRIDAYFKRKIRDDD
jgi:hypothetical protein